MSDTQTVWMILWQHTLQQGAPRPFEISEAVGEVEKALQVSDRDAERLISALLKELERMPEGKQYFRREGNAVVPLPEMSRVAQEPNAELAAYPYEL